MVITLEETKRWLRVDINEEDSIILMLIQSAKSYLANAVGREFTEDDPDYNAAKLLCFVLITDWYENRTAVGEKVGEKFRRIVESMILQLQSSNDQVR